MKIHKNNILTYAVILLALISACSKKPQKAVGTSDPQLIVVQVEKHSALEGKMEPTDEGIRVSDEGWVALTVNIPETGRYRVRVDGEYGDDSFVWIEDHVDNSDGRTYDVTGKVTGRRPYVDGSPFTAGKHPVKLHWEGDIMIDRVVFELLVPHNQTPSTLTQNMDSTAVDFQLVWSDEFDGTSVDTTKWTYDIGNWGWGNNELQYYTANDRNNARVEEGKLIIEAKKDAFDTWTSARLTTRGKVSFLYGRIEFKAIVPRERGNWAAGWTLGDSYRDEKSWPYCGEIDIMESVGYEVDDETGDGIAHCTVHTPAYYFKINNQISNTREVVDIADDFHTYAVEWTPKVIRGYVDGEQYYLYDKNANELEWPFAEPQNIILNLAMGGGWGGAQGLDSTITSQQLVIDYVRVYGKAKSL